MPEKLKATLRIPTREQYAYIEIVIEGTAEEIIKTYLSFTELYKSRAKKWEEDKPPF